MHTILQSDEELIIKIRLGAIDYSWALYYKYKPLSGKIAYSVIPTIIWAIPKSDIDQIFTKSFDSAVGKFPIGTMKFSTYFTSVFKFDLIDYARKFYPTKEENKSALSLDSELRDTPGCYLEDIVADQESKERVYDSIDIREFIEDYDIIKPYLPETTKKILLLLYEGYNLSEIAEEMKISYTKVNRDLKVFREYLKSVKNGADKRVIFKKYPDLVKKFNRFSKRRRKRLDYTKV